MSISLTLGRLVYLEFKIASLMELQSIYLKSKVWTLMRALKALSLINLRF